MLDHVRKPIIRFTGIGPNQRCSTFRNWMRIFSPPSKVECTDLVSLQIIIAKATFLIMTRWTVRCIYMHNPSAIYNWILYNAAMVVIPIIIQTLIFNSWMSFMEKTHTVDCIPITSWLMIPTFLATTSIKWKAQSHSWGKKQSGSFSTAQSIHTKGLRSLVNNIRRQIKDVRDDSATRRNTKSEGTILSKLHFPLGDSLKSESVCVCLR